MSHYGSQGLIFCDMAKNLENTALLIIKSKFYCHFDFANPQSRGVFWGKNFLQNDFCRDMEIFQKHAFGSLILIQNSRKINNLTLSIMFSIMFVGVSVLILGISEHYCELLGSKKIGSVK